MDQARLHSQIRQKRLEANLNVVCYNKFDEEYLKKISEIHEQLYQKQTQDVIVGYLSSIEKGKEKENLSAIFQEMEFKRQSYPNILQILVILHYTQINDNINPIIIAERARNQFGGNLILNISDEYCQTNINLKSALDQYKKVTNSDVNAFDIFNKVEDEDLNKLYFMCLNEADQRDSLCLLVYVNGNNKLNMRNERFAQRILKIAEQFQGSK